jgi:hypothetical protein
MNDVGVGFRIEVAKGEVLEFAADFAHAEAVGDGRVNVESLLSDALAAFERLDAIERAAVVKTVSELDDDDADVGRHGEEHFADALGLAVLAIVEVDLAELGDAIDATGDLFTEEFLEFFERGGGVLDDIMEESGDEAREVHLHASEDARNGERMEHVGLAGVALLMGVKANGKLEGAAERGEVLGGTELLNALREFLVGVLEFIRHGEGRRGGNRRGNARGTGSGLSHGAGKDTTGGFTRKPPALCSDYIE